MPTLSDITSIKVGTLLTVLLPALAMVVTAVWAVADINYKIMSLQARVDANTQAILTRTPSQEDMKYRQDITIRLSNIEEALHDILEQINVRRTTR